MTDVSAPIPHPTPAERHVVDRRIVATALSNAEDESLAVEPGGFVLDEEHYLYLADVALAALDLPARDAGIRAETLRAAYAKVEELIAAYPLPIACAAGIDGEFHTWAFDQIAAVHPAESPVGASVVSAEGSGHPQPATDALLDLARRMTQRADDGDNPSDCWAMADFADELRVLAGASTEEPDRRRSVHPMPRLSAHMPDGGSDA